MKRRKFVGLGTLFGAICAAPAAAAVAKVSDTAKGHELDGEPLPPVKPDHRTRGGTLCPSNAQHFAAKMKEILAGRKFAIVSSSVCGEDTEDIELQTDAEFKTNWVDGSDEPVRASKSEHGFVSLSFSAGYYFYTFMSRAQSPRERNSFADADFRFGDNGQIVVKERTGSGALRVYVFRAQRAAKIDC